MSNESWLAIERRAHYDNSPFDLLEFLVSVVYLRDACERGATAGRLACGPHSNDRQRHVPRYGPG